MARVEFELRSPLRPDEVLANLVDFSQRRLRLWPAIDPTVYVVHEVGDGWTDVAEGSDVFGGIWARERYDWSTPGTVQATVLDFERLASGWHVVAAGRSGAARRQPCHLIVRHRRAKNAKGRLLEVVMRMAGARMLAAELRKAPALGLVDEPG